MAQSANFADFYKFYLGEHSNRTSRQLHFVGTMLFVAQWLAAALGGAPQLWLTGPLTGYGFAWVGHFFFEKNRPATFRNPAFSLLADFVMAWQIIRGKIAF